MLKHLAQSARLNSFNSFSLFIIALITRVIAVFFVTDVNADAVSRVFITLNWLENPHLISSGVWAPLHFYLIAPVIWIFHDHILAPVFINVILGSMTVSLVYLISSELYGKRQAVFSALLFCFMPIAFRQHLMVLAGTPFIFFTALSMYYLLKSKSDVSKEVKLAFWGGLAYTAAAGMRFEAWLLMPLFAGILLLQKQFRVLVVFLATAMIFPAFWLAGNYLATGDALFSIHSSSEWNHLHAGINENVSSFDYYARSYFLPVLFTLNVTPLLLFVFLYFLLVRIWRKELNVNQLLWLTPFIYLFAIFEYKTIIGDLAMHPRYIYSIVFFASIHTGVIRFPERKIMLPLFMILLLSNFIFSFKIFKSSIEDPFRLHPKSYEAIRFLRMYVIGRESAVPLITEQRIPEINRIIKGELRPEDGILADFDTWENTYSIVLNSGKYGDQAFTINWNTLHNEYDPTSLLNFFEKNGSGLFVTIRESKLTEADLKILSDSEMIMVDRVRLRYKMIHSDEKYTIYKYEVMATNHQE